jgi:hypothetical protein
MTHAPLRIVLVSLLSLTLVSLPALSLPAPAHAAVSTWIRGSSVLPTNPDDYGSTNFQQSLRNLKATGATYVGFTIPYYQSNIYSTDIGPGFNTPTDAALAAGIDYAHSIGLAVAFKIHVEPYDGNWRAYINPSDRTTWFNNYGSVLVHLGQIAATHHVELINLGTEMVSVAASNMNSTNTQNWITLIQKVRAVFSGKLVYDAGSNNNNDDPFENEKKYIGFWSYLDYAGLSAYYSLNGPDNSVQSLEAAWDAWNKNDIQGFAASVGKPILFTEVGYRSLQGAHTAPWNWGASGGADLTEQANDYQALIEYWNAYPYMQGVFFWDWSPNPSAGGSGDTGYTPQNKPAEQVMKKWFTSAPPPPPPTNAPMFSGSASATPTSPSTGTASTITATVKDTSGTLANGIVDLEVYNASNQRVLQKFFSGQSFATGASQSYSAAWTPSATGTYRVTIGVFTSDWSTNYYWNNDALDVTVGSSSTQPPPPSGSQTTDVWWPTNNAHVSGVQPLKAMVENSDVSQYTMTWQVDGGSPVPMNDSQADYPHKEALIDFTSWKWLGSGPYRLTLVSKDHSGKVISQAAIQVYTP